MLIKKAVLLMGNIHLNPYQIHKFRGFIGNLFSKYDVIHNHDPESGKPIYRYPLIQFKRIDSCPCIVAVTDAAVHLFSEIFMKLDNILIDEVPIPVYEKNLKVEEVAFGFSKDVFVYEFISPWIGLNQRNYREYIRTRDDKRKRDILKKALTGNLLSMSKYLGHWLAKDQKIETEILLEENTVNLKGNPLLGFRGIFKVNFLIPDDLGIGKSVSRGFGTVRRFI